MVVFSFNLYQLTVVPKEDSGVDGAKYLTSFLGNRPSGLFGLFGGILPWDILKTTSSKMGLDAFSGKTGGKISVSGRTSLCSHIIHKNLTCFLYR